MEVPRTAVPHDARDIPLLRVAGRRCEGG